MLRLRAAHVPTAHRVLVVPEGRMREALGSWLPLLAIALFGWALGGWWGLGLAGALIGYVLALALAMAAGTPVRRDGD